MITSLQGKIGPKGLPGPSGPKGEPVSDYDFYMVFIKMHLTVRYDFRQTSVSNRACQAEMAKMALRDSMVKK